VLDADGIVVTLDFAARTVTRALASGHRKTSNSRGPSQDAVVRYCAGRLVLCPKCGTRFYGGVHVPHFNAAGVLVDCVGEAVRP